MRKNIFTIVLAATMALFASSALADTSVSWTSPPDGSSYLAGTLVAPTGTASGSGITGGTGLDLALVIDTSGSMGWTVPGGGVGMDYARAAAISLVNNLPINTTSVAVIGFSSSANTYQVLTALNPDKQAIIDAINSLPTSGGTNIGSGVVKGAEELLAGHTTGRQMMQVVLSDGQGTYSGQAKAAYLNHGIVTHAVGVPGHNVTQMQEVAADGNGFYTNVTNLADLEGLFSGTTGNLVGLERVDIELADGGFITGIPTDGLGNFTLPDQVIALGANTFTAYAYGTDGTSASVVLTLYGTDNGHAPVPEPGTMLLFGAGLAGLAAFGRRKKA